MPFYEFVCPAGHEAEVRANYETASLPCSVCGDVAQRQSVYPISFSMAGKEFVPFDQRRIQLSKFMDAASDLEYHHKTAEERQGRKIETPNYFHEGVQRANEVLAGKRAPPKEF